MCSACGASPSGAFASRAARWRTPKRCCSSTTTTARSLNSTGSSISACVPTTSWSAPDPSAPSRSRRRAAGVEPVSSSTGIAPPSSRSSVRWCCSASVSVGAISAAWAPFSTARSIACSATTVLPAPTSPISSRCIGRSSPMSASSSSIARFWSPGQLERERPAPAVHHDPARGQRARPATLPARAPAAGHGELQQEQLLEREPVARAALVLLAVREVRAGQRGRALRQRLVHAQPGGQRLGREQEAPARVPQELAQARGAQALGGRVHRHQADGVHRSVAPAERLVLGHPELTAAAEPAVQQHLRALAQLAGEPGLVEPDRHERAALVRGARLDPLAPPVAHRPDAHRAHDHGHRGLLPQQRGPPPGGRRGGRGASAGGAR